MFHCFSLILVASSMLGFVAAPAAAQQKLSFNFETGDRNGICSVAIPAGDRGLKVEFSIRVEDRNVNVIMQNIDGDIVNAALDAGRKPQLALVFDGQRRHDIDKGEYVAGFTYRAVGSWSDQNRAAAALDDLNLSETITFVADDKSWGPIPLQVKGMAFNLLQKCIERNDAAIEAEVATVVQQVMTQYRNGTADRDTIVYRNQQLACLSYWIALLTMHQNKSGDPFWSGLPTELNLATAEATSEAWATRMLADIGDDEEANQKLAKDVDYLTEDVYERIESSMDDKDILDFFDVLGACSLPEN